MSMSMKEKAVKAALRAVPSHQRDEITATFTDNATTKRGYGFITELGSIAIHGVRHRLGLDAASAPGRALMLAAPLLVGSVGLFVILALADSILMHLDVVPYRYSNFSFQGIPLYVGRRLIADVLVFGGWSLLFASACLKLRPAIQRILALMTATAGAIALLATYVGPVMFPMSQFTGYVIVLSVLATLVVACAPIEPLTGGLLSRIPLLVGICAVSIAGGVGLIRNAFQYVQIPRRFSPNFVADGTEAIVLGAIIVVVAGLLCAVVAAQRGLCSPEWPLAVCVAGIPWVAFASVGTQFYWSPMKIIAIQMTLGFAAIAGLLWVAVLRDRYSRLQAQLGLT